MPKEKRKRITAENYLKYYYDIPYEGTTSAGKPLRKLKDITCPYRGIKIIPSDMIKGFEKNLAKCKTASDAVKLLSAYQKNMLQSIIFFFIIPRRTSGMCWRDAPTPLCILFYPCANQSLYLNIILMLFNFLQ